MSFFIRDILNIAKLYKKKRFSSKVLERTALDRNGMKRHLNPLFDSKLAEDVWKMCMGTASKTFAYEQKVKSHRACFKWRHEAMNGSIVQMQDVHYSQ